MSGDPGPPGFAGGSRLTVGVEEELLLVDGELGLAPVAEQILARLAAEAGEASAGHEAYASQIELRSAPSPGVEEAVQELGRLRAGAVGAGARPIGVGVHPLARAGDAVLVDSPRYRKVAGSMRGLLARTPEAALHVHVGVPDGEAAVAAHNALRAHLPLLIGLSGNSPWWFGADSGFASARYLLVRAYPGRGVAGPFESYDHYAGTAAAAMRAADVADYTYLWWDVRLHPLLGTVEVRELDAQSSLLDVAALAALVQCLAGEACERPAAEHPPAEALSQSAFQAARDGTGARILDGEDLRPLESVARETLRRLSPLARELGCDGALEEVERLLEQGGGAGRRRADAARGGPRAMLEELVAETARPLR